MTVMTRMVMTTAMMTMVIMVVTRSETVWKRS